MMIELFELLCVCLITTDAYINIIHYPISTNHQYTVHVLWLSHCAHIVIETFWLYHHYTTIVVSLRYHHTSWLLSINQ